MLSLNIIFLSLLAILIVGILLSTTVKPIGIIQFPFLAAAVIAGWVFPQLLGLIVLQTAPPEAIAKTVTFTGMCLAAGWLGYAKNRRAARMNWRFSTLRLKIAALTLSLAGFFFWARVSDMAAEATELYGGQWSGAITIYVFLGGMLEVGLAIALVLHIRRPSFFSTSIIVLDLTLILERALFQARREDMVELFVFMMLFLWWRYRWLPPRIVLICVIIFGAFVVNSIGTIRGAQSMSLAQSIESFSDISAFLENFQATMHDSMRSNELLNAALMIEGADRRMSFDGGAYLWNRFVHSFIPGQIIGSDNKANLMIDTEDVAFMEFGHIPHIGTTHTGIADVFRSFWYLGAGVFFLIGRIMSRWFRAAQEGHPTAQMVTLLITTKSLLAITHTSSHFFLNFVTLAVFLAPALFFSRSDLVFRGR